MIRELVHAHGIAVIEDCVQAYGARIHGQSVGSFGDVAAWGGGSPPCVDSRDCDSVRLVQNSKSTETPGPRVACLVDQGPMTAPPHGS